MDKRLGVCLVSSYLFICLLLNNSKFLFEKESLALQLTGEQIGVLERKGGGGGGEE